MAGSMPSATRTRRVSARASSLAAAHAGHPLGRAGDLGNLVRGALPDQARDQRAALAARDGGDEEPGERRGARGQGDLGVAEQHEAEPDDERQHRAEGGVARALREAREHGGGGMRDRLRDRRRRKRGARPRRMHRQVPAGSEAPRSGDYPSGEVAAARAQPGRERDASQREQRDQRDQPRPGARRAA